MKFPFDINSFNEITTFVIASVNGLLFVFYFLLLILYIKQYKYKHIIAFLSIQLLISTSFVSFFYIYGYIKAYNKILCSLNAIFQPSVTTSAICFIGYIPYVSIKILTNPDKIEERFNYFAILSAILCWILPVILCAVLFIIDIQVKTEIWTVCTVRSYFPKSINYSMYFVLSLILEFIFLKLQGELGRFIKDVEKKTKGKIKEKCIIQFKQFHIMNFLNLVWQIFTLFITFNWLSLEKNTLDIIKPIIRFVNTVLCFFFVFILCVNKEKMKDLSFLLCCKLKTLNERLTNSTSINSESYEQLGPSFFEESLM